MHRTLLFAYAVACHGLFLGIYAWMAGFVGNFLVPKTIDAPVISPFGTALAINLGLIAAFGVQHSVMARPWFKRAWTRVIPEPVERSTYVLASCLAVALLMWQWRPLGPIVWDVRQPAVRWALHGLFAFGWLMVPTVSLMINHFDLFGTRQAWLHLHGRAYEPLPFRTPMLYARIRHPLYVGWAIAFWATPTMTAAHLVFAVGTTAYMLIAIPHEERDLTDHFGDRYREYRRRVPALVPWRSRPAAAVSPGPQAAAPADDAPTRTAAA